MIITYQKLYNINMNSDFKHRQHHISFRSAISGLVLALTSEINMKIIIACTILVIVAGFVWQISYNEWLTVLLAVALVFMAEMINTSVEAVTDLVTSEWRQDAKIAKDVSGGMVLVASLFALVIGIIIFLPKLNN